MPQSSQHIHWFPIGLVLCLALVTWWLNDLARLPQIADNRGFTHDPDAIVDEFRVLSFDRTGQPQNQLSAKHMRHFMEDDTTELVEPRIEFYDPVRSARVRAQRAVIGSSGENIYLLNQVHVDQTMQDSQVQVTLDTEYLQVTPQAKLMTTDRPVVMRQGRSVVMAGGLYLDNRQRTLLLNGGVKGSYDTAQ